ncbi:DNA primase/helicase [Rhodococcus aetherivorans]|uniref:DNA primase/helicase n=1 Tax=Rhodococcus aetherivorans TaxID=191292 RepID=A0ABQ0YNF9_9NOCA|nr:bifunctional DNA primase/polymerase [Rhodococcus aetherivorans]ETT28770.1 Bifunctional DNA primase/polymerase [Rhodococcus rhodochrous ATCC 21198]NGP26393.1 AAA family ATPase [Rhodococcus aetherivorans]GES37940.1 DNA primase/helicase [Rhodococcus aetherivorans]
MTDADHDAIYSRGAPVYRRAGWTAPLPFPPREKFPPPAGWSGHDGRWPDDAQIGLWAREHPASSNLGLRLDYGIVGIDVDAYDAKTGGQTLKEAETRWGPLPRTYRSSSRLDDKTSGIRVFRAPEDVMFQSRIAFPDSAIGDVEIVQPHHRFVITWPSIHPKTGQQYRWFGPDGRLLPEGVVPVVEDLAELPEAWVSALAKDAVREEAFAGSTPLQSGVESAVDSALYEELRHLRDDGAPDTVVAARLQRALTDLSDGAGSRYDATRDHVLALMRYHSCGRIGVPRALEELFTVYVTEVMDTRSPRVAEAEFKRFTEGAALLVAATPPTDASSVLGIERSVTGEIGEGVASSRMEGSAELSSWEPVDLEDVLAGDRELLVPTLFERADGVCLLYPGMVHSFHGESESGKSLIAQIECVRVLKQGRDVLYLDFESDASSVVERLLEFGATAESIRAHFHYHQPEVQPSTLQDRRAWEQMLTGAYALAVVDGVTDALGVFGCATKDNDEVARWIRAVPKAIAARTGAAVVLIDHVTKDTSSRGRFAIGGQSKMAGLTGAAYTVEVAQPLGRGLRGEVVLRVGKDRPGAVRPHCGSFHKKDRTQEAARVVIDSTASPPVVTIHPPGASQDGEPNADSAEFRPTALMERISKLIEKQPGELTKTKAGDLAGGQKQSRLHAAGVLLSEGFLSSERGRGGHDVLSSVKPYREADDPRSDRFLAGGNLQCSK